MGDSDPNKMPNLLGALGYHTPPLSAFSASLLGGLLAQPETKRRAYFAFDFDDVMRVNNVRNAWKVGRPDDAFSRSFYDSSLWESRKLEGEDALKRLMREGIEKTSAVSVLVGSDTWKSRWVKYEIARAVIDGRGLLAVHINGLTHHYRRTPDLLGPNPLQYLGVCQTMPGVFRLYEYRYAVTNHLTGVGAWQWHPYGDYTSAVELPRYLRCPDVGYVQPLSVGAAEYDYVAQAGVYSIGRWIDQAAIAVGR